MDHTRTAHGDSRELDYSSKALAIVCTVAVPARESENEPARDSYPSVDDLTQRRGEDRGVPTAVCGPVTSLTRSALHFDA